MSKDSSNRSKGRKVAIFLGRACLFSVIAVAALYGYIRYDFVQKANGLDAELAKAKELGIPTTQEEMVRSASIPPNENAAVAITQAHQENLSNFKTEMRVLHEGMTLARRDVAEAIQPVRESIQNLLPYTERARAISRMPQFAMDLDWSDEGDLKFDAYVYLKQAAFMLATEAEFLALSGDWSRVSENIEAIGRLAELAGQGQILLSGLMKLTISSYAYTLVQRLTYRNHADSNRLTILRNAIAKLQVTTTIEPYLKGEAYVGALRAGSMTKKMDSVAAHLSPGHKKASLMNRWSVIPPLIGGDLANKAYRSMAVKHWNESIESIRSSPDEVGQTARSLAVKEVMAKNGASPWNQGILVAFSSAGNIGLEFERHATVHAYTLAAIDIHMYRLRHGRHPESIKDATKSLVDPFGDGTLRYLKTPTGFVVYSIGPDGINSKGTFRHDGTAESNRVDDRGLRFPPRIEWSAEHEKHVLERFRRAVHQTRSERKKLLATRM